MDINILVVDDSEIMRRVIERTLNINGFESTSIFEASNGKEGLQAIAQHEIDLLLVDVNMPIMDGIQMLKQLNSINANRDFSIVIVSAESNEKRIEQLSQLGAKFIHKPFTPEKLMAEMQQFI